MIRLKYFKSGIAGLTAMAMIMTAVPFTGAASVNAETVRGNIVRVQGSEEDAVAADAEKLSIEGVSKASADGKVYVDDVRGNITLPLTGENGSTIKWTSSDTTIITDKAKDNKDAGVVTRQSGDKKVTMTATITSGSASATKEFVCTVKKAPKEVETTDYLFAFFPYTNQKDERIYFATSEDGLNYKGLNNNQFVIESREGTHGLRDPFVIRSPEGDRFYMIATDLTVAGVTQDGVYYPGKSWSGPEGNQQSGSKCIMVWESTDLVNWGEQRVCQVAADDAGCAWAPEAYWDDETGQYVVFWASKTAEEDNYTNQRLWYATTRDFRTFSEPEIWIEMAGSVIDTTVIKVDDYYYRYTKNEAGNTNEYGTPSKRIFCERSESMLSTEWELVNTNSLPVSGNKQIEGGCIFKINEDDEDNALYVAGLKGYDMEGDDVFCLAADLTGVTVFPGLATDITTGTFNILGTRKQEVVDGTSIYSMPDPDASHGTMMPITSEEYNNIMIKWDSKYAEAAADFAADAEAAEKALTLADTATADITLPAKGARAATITWESSDESIISAKGKVTRPAHTAGDAVVQLTATITIEGDTVEVEDGDGYVEVKVRDQVKTKDFFVTVKCADAPTQPTQSVQPTQPTQATTPAPTEVVAAKVALNKTKVTLGANEKFQLKATVTPANAANKSVKWQSKNTKVATVSAAGKVTAKKAGTAKIVATTANGKTATCTITVKKAPKKIKLNKNKVTLKKGKTFTIKVKYPGGGACYAPKFSSSKKKVATVDAKGKVKALKKGNAVITVKTHNNKTAKLKVKVK